MAAPTGSGGAGATVIQPDAGPMVNGAIVDAGRVLPPPSAWFGPRVVVGVGFGGRRILSRDGTSWAQDVQDEKANATESTRTLNDATFAADMVVAVGGGCLMGICGPRVITFNGDVWTERKAPEAVGTLRAVTYGLGKFVAIGSLGVVATSTDGKQWGSYDPGMGLLKGARRIAFGKIGNSSSFVIVGDNGLRAFSDDGDKWRLVTRAFPGTDSQIDLVTVAIGSGSVVAAGTQGRRIRSNTGVEWSDIAAGGGTITSLIYSDKRFVAFDDAGNAHKSENEGQSWSSTTVIAAPKAAVETGMMASARLFVGAQGSVILASQDGIFWRETQKSAGFPFTRFVFAGP